MTLLELGVLRSKISILRGAISCSYHKGKWKITKNSLMFWQDNRNNEVYPPLFSTLTHPRLEIRLHQRRGQRIHDKGRRAKKWKERRLQQTHDCENRKCSVIYPKNRRGLGSKSTATLATGYESGVKRRLRS